MNRTRQWLARPGARQATKDDLLDVCDGLGSSLRGVAVRYDRGSSVGSLRQEMRELLVEVAERLAIKPATEADWQAFKEGKL